MPLNALKIAVAGREAVSECHSSNTTIERWASLDDNKEVRMVRVLRENVGDASASLAGDSDEVSDQARWSQA